MYSNEKGSQKQDKNSQINQKSLKMYYTLKQNLETEIEQHLLTESARAKLQYLQVCIENQNSQVIKQKKIALLNQLTEDQANIYFNFTPQKQLDKYIFIANKILIHHQNFNYLTDTFQIQTDQNSKWSESQIQLNRLKGIVTLQKFNLSINLINAVIKPENDPKSENKILHLSLQYQIKAQKFSEIKIKHQDQQKLQKWIFAINQSSQDLAKKLQYQEQKKQMQNLKKTEILEKSQVSNNSNRSRTDSKSFSMSPLKFKDQIYSNVITLDQNLNSNQDLNNQSSIYNNQINENGNQNFRNLPSLNQKSSMSPQPTKINDIAYSFSNNEKLNSSNLNFIHNQQQKQLINQNLINQRNFCQNKEIPGNYSQMIQKLQSELDHKLVYQSSQIRILQNKNASENFKLKMTHHTPCYNLLLVLNQYELYQNWNMDIVQTEILKSLANQYLIVYQRTKSKSMFYKDREYIFQRQFKQFNDIYLMLDQSIDFDLEDTLFKKQSQYFLQKGTIEFANWGFFTNQGGNQFNNLMIVDIKMNNNGFISSAQNQHMIIDYLKSFEGLDLFASQYLLSSDKQQLLRTFNIYPFETTYSSNNNSSNNSSNLRVPQTQFQTIQNKNTTPNQKEEQIQIQQQQQQNQHNQQVESQNSSQEKSLAPIKEQIQEQEIKQVEIKKEEIQNQENQNQIQEILQNSQPQIKSDNSIKTENSDLQLAYEILKLNEIIDQEFIPFFHILPSAELQRAVERKIELLRQNKHFLISCLKHQYEMKTSEIKEPKNQIKTHFGVDLLRNDFKRDPKKGVLEFNNKEKEKLIGKATTFVLKKIGKNIFTAKSLINISLPIFVFDFSSNLYRQALGLGYTPTHLDNAADSQNPVEQMKWVVTNQITTLVIQLNISKPFNPILGETFQGFVNNNPVYYEQISHHPPIFAFQYFGKDFVYFGNGQTIVNMHANSVNAANIGFYQVKFTKTQNTIYTTCPETIFTGTMMGNRMINLDGKIYGWDLQNNLYCEIQINPKKKSLFYNPEFKTVEDYFGGGIFEITPQFKEKIEIAMSKRIASTGQKLQLDNLKEKDIVKQLSSCNGIWHQSINWDDKELWNIDKAKLYPIQHELFALPSDCNHRLDTLSWKCRDQDKSQIVKEELENAQRHDKKLRQKYQKQIKKK